MHECIKDVDRKWTCSRWRQRDSSSLFLGLYLYFCFSQFQGSSAEHFLNPAKVNVNDQSTWHLSSKGK